MSQSAGRRSARLVPSEPITQDMDFLGSDIVNETAREAAQSKADRKRRVHLHRQVLQHASADSRRQDSRLDTLLERLTEAVISKPNEITDLIPTKGPDARSPDKFDGSNPSRLRPFLSQCRLVFLNHSKRFATDRAKVLYAGSYLSGVAADWFEPFTRDEGAEAVVLNNWQLFQDRLEEVFGDSNAEATAEYRLSTLRMKSDEQISSYITRFRTYSADLHWDDAPLRFAFRQGLTDRILDELARTDSPRTLSDLMEASLKIDNRYWERQREKKLSSRSRTTDSNNDESFRKSSRSGNKFLKRTSDSRTHSKISSTSDDKSNTYSHRPTASKDRKNLDKVLTKDGKLNSSEKARRAEKGLCGYCGGPHSIDKCPVKPQTSSGRSASTKEVIKEDAHSGKD